MRGGIKQLLTGNGVKHLTGTASFIDRTTLDVSGTRIGAKKVIIATGSEVELAVKSADELGKIYLEGCQLTPDKEVVAYCRIGERSSHTWFVLSYLLGLKKVRNYDGSWTEWGNRVRAPIERSD